MKCLQNIEIDGLVFLGCIYPRLTTDNTAVGPIGPMGAGKLRAGVRVRALMWRIFIYTDYDFGPLPFTLVKLSISIDCFD